MKYILSVSLLFFSLNSYASRCSDHFAHGEEYFLIAVDDNKLANQEVKDGDHYRLQSELLSACHSYDIAIGIYNSVVTNLESAGKEMVLASKRCIFGQRTRAKENLEMIENAIISIEINQDKAITRYKRYCQ